MHDEAFSKLEVLHRLVKDARLSELWRSGTNAAHVTPAPVPGRAIVCFRCTENKITDQSQDDSQLQVVLAFASGPNRVCVVFSKQVDSATATNLANYFIDGGATVSGATVSTDGTVVTLTVGGLIGGDRSITISGVHDQSGNDQTPDPALFSFTFNSDVIDAPCPDNPLLLSEAGYWPGDFCHRDAEAASVDNAYPYYDALTNAECLGVPLNPDEELHPGRYYIGFVAGSRNGKAVVVVVALEGDDLGTATSTSTSTAVHFDGCDCNPISTCRWLASLHTTDCLTLTVEDASGQFAGLNLTQSITWQFGTTSSATFNWTGGTGTVILTVSSGTPHLTIGGHELVFVCCDEGSAVFAGGPATGFLGSSQTPSGDCPKDRFCVRVTCDCCSITGWGGEGWYCVDETGTASGTSRCMAVELLNEDRCDSTIYICSGPYADEAAALTHCPSWAHFGPVCDTTPGGECAAAIILHESQWVTAVIPGGYHGWFNVRLTGFTDFTFAALDYLTTGGLTWNMYNGSVNENSCQTGMSFNSFGSVAAPSGCIPFYTGNPHALTLKDLALFMCFANTGGTDVTLTIRARNSSC